MSTETFTPAELEAFERVMRNAVRNDFYAFVETTFQTVCPASRSCRTGTSMPFAMR